jgi:hypothetical protein
MMTQTHPEHAQEAADNQHHINAHQFFIDRPNDVCVCVFVGQTKNNFEIYLNFFGLVL